MEMNRRQFNGLALSALSVALSGAGIGEAFAGADNTPLSVKTLNRLIFGATQARITDFDNLGKAAWLQHELAKPVSDPALVRRLAAARARAQAQR